MTAFFTGALLGALFIGAGFLLYLNRLTQQKREIEPWREDTYQQPVVTTRIVNRHRSIEL